jgi:DNA (cytosine-5)-methyltransferase 1
VNELALFAGAGGGILGGKLLGWRTVCAVELDAYAAAVLAQRQNDGCLEPFPIWSDIRTFDGRPWKGIIDVVSGGFPCQDISNSSSTKSGLFGERSGLWSEMRRVVCEVGPKFVFVENSPALTNRGLGLILSDLAILGFNAKWGLFRASDVKLPHERERIWIVANSDKIVGKEGARIKQQFEKIKNEFEFDRSSVEDRQNMWVEMARSFYRVDDGMAFKVDRTEAIGNGQVPAVVRLAWEVLT